MSATEGLSYLADEPGDLKAETANRLSALDGALVVPPSIRRAAPSGTSYALQRVVPPLAIFGLWWLASAQGWLNPQVLSSPWATWDAFYQLAVTGQLWKNLSISLARAMIGLGCGLVAGVSLGLFTGLTGIGDRVVDPLVQMLRTVPVLALAPLFIVWLGIGETPKIVLIAVATTFPLYVNTHGGVRSIDPKIREAAWIFGVSRFRLVRQIILPAALPTMLVGLRLSLGIALLALVFAEQINASSGIGYLMVQAQNYFNTDILVVCILIYAAWGLLGDLLVRLLGYVLLPWRRTNRVG